MRILGIDTLQKYLNWKVVPLLDKHLKIKISLYHYDVCPWQLPFANMMPAPTHKTNVPLVNVAMRWPALYCP